MEESLAKASPYTEKLRDRLVVVTMEWERVFGVAPSITSAVSEYDAACLVGHTDESYGKAWVGRTAVTRGCDFIFNGLRYQVKANRPSGKSGSFVTLVGKASNYDWDRLIWVLYDRYFVLQEAWEWEVGQYRLLKSPGRIKFDRVDHSNLPPLLPRYNIAPSQNVLAVLQSDGEREAAFLQWGLLPSWSKDGKGFINARSETIEGTPSFSESFHRGRCLIPADGFYEWQRSGKIAQPYFFHMKDESPFAFARIWDEWQGDGKVIASCAIITTTANELLASIHDRMPVILRPESQESWLDGDSGALTLRNLLAPFPASEMASHAVSYDVNHPKIDDEYLTKPVVPNIGVTPSLF